MVFNTTFNNISAISLSVGFIGEGNRSTRRKPLTFRDHIKNMFFLKYNIIIYLVHFISSSCSCYNEDCLALRPFINMVAFIRHVYTYEFLLSLCKIVRSSVILLLLLLIDVILNQYQEYFSKNHHIYEWGRFMVFNTV
jgi:hypothetical protein